jgi:hypothetical protein
MIKVQPGLDHIRKTKSIDRENLIRVFLSAPKYLPYLSFFSKFNLRWIIRYFRILKFYIKIHLASLPILEYLRFINIYAAIRSCHCLFSKRHSIFEMYRFQTLGVVTTTVFSIGSICSSALLYFS